jgi:hypothetical protein
MSYVTGVCFLALAGEQAWNRPRRSELGPTPWRRLPPVGSESALRAARAGKLGGAVEGQELHVRGVGRPPHVDVIAQKFQRRAWGPRIVVQREQDCTVQDKDKRRIKELEEG